MNSNGNWNTLCKHDLCERYDVFQRECFSHAYADAIKVYKARAKKRRKIEACPPCQLQKLAVKTKVPRPSNETNRAPDHNWFQGKIDGEPELYRWSAISQSDKPRKRKKQGSSTWAHVCDTPKCLNIVTKGSHFCLECKNKYE